METIKEKKNKKIAGKSGKQSEITEQRPKSKIMLWREKHPEGIGYIVNMRAVLR